MKNNYQIYLGARKLFWNFVNRAKKNGTTIILGTHSMEECEALCDNLGILINGQMKCFGSLAQLKETYGDDLRLVIKCKARIDENMPESTNSISYMKRFFQVNIPNSTLEGR